jgi:hypothetical protein
VNLQSRTSLSGGPNHPQLCRRQEILIPTIDASTFRRDFGQNKDEARREPVKVPNHGRVIGGFLSSHDLEHFERLKRRERQVYVAGEIPDDIIDAIRKAEYLKPPAGQTLRQPHVP